MRKKTFIITLAASALLAACGSDQPAEDAVEAAPAGEEMADAPVAEPTPAEASAPAAVAEADAVRGPGGLEASCLARVTQETGGATTSTNRIEESEAAVEVYVNVEGAAAPWRCLGNRDGTIEEVSFTGSEGDL